LTIKKIGSLDDVVFNHVGSWGCDSNLERIFVGVLGEPLLKQFLPADRCSINQYRKCLKKFEGLESFDIVSTPRTQGQRSLWWFLRDLPGSPLSSGDGKLE
jgi:hypothetical protein